MCSQLVCYQVIDQAAWITIARPERLNALNLDVLAQLRQHMQTAQQDRSARVIVLTGAGTKSFCAGADIDSFYDQAQATQDDKAWQMREDLAGLFEQMLTSHKPLVGRVNGFALGGGLGLAMACDIVVATEQAQFGTPEINLGLFPMVIMPVLYRSIGRKKLLEMMLVGERISAPEALQMGMINKMVPAEHLDAEVANYVSKLASKSGRTLLLGRQAFYTMADMELRQALTYMKSMLGANLATQDAREGLNAFLDKRTPLWQDR